MSNQIYEAERDWWYYQAKMSMTVSEVQKSLADTLRAHGLEIKPIGIGAELFRRATSPHQPAPLCEEGEEGK